MALGASAFFLGDLIVGMAAYCLITLPVLWYFSFTWLNLSGLLASHGQSLGSSWQLGLAWAGTLGAVPLMAAVVYLSVRAFRLPMTIARRIGRPTPKPTG